IHNELDNSAYSQIAGDYLAAAIPQYQRRRGADKKNHQRRIKSDDARGINLCVVNIPSTSIKFFTRFLFLGKTFDDSDSSETFLECNADSCYLLLHFKPNRPKAATRTNSSPRHDRYEGQSHERQPPV